MLEDQERRWTFSPLQPWRALAYKSVIQMMLEDLSGNNFGKPFEVDFLEDVESHLIDSAVELPFEVR